MFELMIQLNALELIKNADICSYNLKTESNKNKQHIGLVIDEERKYNCPNEVIAEDKQGIDQYSMTSLSWKAHQETIKKDNEQDKKIYKLYNTIKILQEKIIMLERKMT